jgi:hypothetical protein
VQVVLVVLVVETILVFKVLTRYFLLLLLLVAVLVQVKQPQEVATEVLVAVVLETQEMQQGLEYLVKDLMEVQVILLFKHLEVVAVQEWLVKPNNILYLAMEETD